MRDRRVGFFAGGSVLAALLAIISLDEVRLVPVIVAVVYAILAVAIHFDAKNRTRR